MKYQPTKMAWRLWRYSVIRLPVPKPGKVIKSILYSVAWRYSSAGTVAEQRKGR